MFIRTVERDTSLDAFRAEVREFCERELPAEVRRKQAAGQHLEREEYDDWLKRLGAKGWLTGKWPVEHGGLGWSPEQFLIFCEELGRAGAPPLVPFGPTMAGPVIYTFGTEKHKADYLPGIIKNETWWCQGYSEPGAGSDLANLKTKAERDGDHYIVNGQKIWTSQAHWADMMFCLVRTSQGGKKQQGISFLLIDMKTPGITVRPIIAITLGHHLNEVFFDDVRVPVENLIGEEGKGWTYAKFLLANERVGNVDIAKFEHYLDSLRKLLAQTKDGGRPLSEDPAFRRRVAELEVGLATVRALMADQLAATREEGGAPTMMGAAALKLRGTEVQQAILQTIVDVLGRHGLVYQTDALNAGWNGEFIGPEDSAGLMYEHLYRRAATIYGGSSEIQKNIIAKGALGL
ncbi:MAG TPA: acyl-CoA dehydrogenase family protein [Hyphomicrobiaceae bacterium]|nr:acyl-CoA dehydrogenase family protein [Hyphomicrobiaceae bacterium]